MIKRSLLTLMAFSLMGCPSGNDDDTKSDDAYDAKGKVEKITSTSITLTFADGEKGAQYFIMPFATGSTTGSDATQGGDSSVTELKFNVAVSGSSTLHMAGGGSGQGFQGNPEPLKMDGRTFDHALRTLLNRFDPQNPTHWKLVASLEEAKVTDGPYANGTGLVDQPRNLKPIFESLEHTPSEPSFGFAGVCPSVSEVYALGNGGAVSTAPKLDPTLVSLKAESASYCLYVHNTRGLVTESSVDKIKAGIESALASYKDVIYQDSFAVTKGTYKFQPLFIVLPYGEDSSWVSPKISAAFVGSLSVAHGRPTLYIASDQSKVNEETDKSKLVELFHSSIAHELQHAILHYYRYTKNLTDTTNLTPDAPQFDEGLAHYMEDLLGYGEVNFSSYPQSYLAGFSTSEGINPVLPDITSGTAKAFQRGAAQIFMYYLVSQKKGVTFDGTVSGGEGLGFIRAFASGTKTNIAGITAAYGGNWVDAIGGLFGALAIDGASTVKEPDEFKVQKPEKDITDTVGTTGKTFGMRFNNFGTIDDLKAKLGGFTKLDAAGAAIAVPEYSTVPLLLTLGSANDTVEITTQQKYDNAGVTVIRFK